MSTRTSMCMSPPRSTTSAACWGRRRSRPRPPATASCCTGCRSFGEVELVGVEGTGSYGAGLTRSPARPGRRGGRGRSAEPADAGAGGQVRPATTRSARPAPRRVAPRGAAKTRTATSRPCGFCGSRRSAPARPAPRRSTRCARSSPPHPTSCAPSCADLTIHRADPRLRRPAPPGQHRRRIASPSRRCGRWPAESRHLESRDRRPRRLLAPLVADRARADRPTPASAPTPPPRCSSPPATTPTGSATKPPSPTSAASHPSTPPAANQQRHRLNRGGDRQANSALWRIVITRMVHDPDTRAYIERRTNEGLTKKEAIRCLKRYIARELYNDLPQPNSPLTAPRSIITERWPRRGVARKFSRATAHCRGCTFTQPM